MIVRPARAPRARRAGQSLVEFALVFPVALVLILAVFDIGRAVFVYNGLTNAAREGARLAIVNQNETDIAERVRAMAIGTAVSNIGDADLVAFRVENLADGTTTDEDCPSIVTGCVAVVTARADWSAITPIIGSIVGPVTLEAQAELPVEFVCDTACPRQP